MSADSTAGTEVALKRRLIIAVAAALLGLGDVGGAAELELVLRDAVTGGPLDAWIELHAVDRTQGVTPDLAEVVVHRAADSRVQVDGGRARLDVFGPTMARAHAPGYASLITVLEPGAHAWTLWLTPLDSEVSIRDTVAPGFMRLHGVVRDPDSLHPVADAELRLEPLGLVSHSDGDGGYLFEFAVPQHHDEVPRFLSLEVRAPGWPVMVDDAIPAVAGETRRFIDLGASGQALHRLQHPLHTGIQIEDRAPRQAVAGVDPDQPPLSVRVGFADASCTQICCTQSCTHVCVFDLETYVRRGITYEWIASWAQDSLRAGTIAYRSYGAWHALNPVAGRPFDLCSSACCQVNGPNIHSNGIQAARRTAGLMLKRNGNLFRSEYSAENNCLLGSASCSNIDLSCGDGYNGSPSIDWPCLADSVGLGRDCFGHGRGMSQWGTQRWSNSPHFRLWPWIVDHYFNAHGAGTGMRTAIMTRVLGILDVAPAPAVVAPGEAFEIVVETLNRAAESHQAVLIGASIRRGSDPFLSDPPNDRLVELESGVDIATRDFLVPVGTPPGIYALWVALYLDVDGNGAIGSNDLVQSLVQFPAALQIVDLGEAVFADGFEPKDPDGKHGRR
jgi:hypothetical protein